MIKEGNIDGKVIKVEGAHTTTTIAILVLNPPPPLATSFIITLTSPLVYQSIMEQAAQRQTPRKNHQRQNTHHNTIKNTPPTPALTLSTAEKHHTIRYDWYISHGIALSSHHPPTPTHPIQPTERTNKYNVSPLPPFLSDTQPFNHSSIKINIGQKVVVVINVMDTQTTSNMTCWDLY